MIAILDYGLGNIRSISNMLRKAGAQSFVAATADELRGAERAILPGVGSFDAGMQRLDRSGLRPALEDHVAAGRPLLGICLGMQMLGRSSEEGTAPGLGLLSGDTVRLRPPDGRPVPHMGWTPVEPTRPSAIFPSPSDDLRFYFLHSFHLACEDPADVVAVADYGEPVTAAAGRANVLGVQFHPEKSHRHGLELLQLWSNAL